MNQNQIKGHILIVDDEPFICDMLKYSLESGNYKVSIAYNGLEALYTIRDQEIDVVLIDIRMPVMDGLAAVKFLRKCEQGEHLSLSNEHHELALSLYARRKGARMPVVIVTGNIDDWNFLKQAGMDEYISKPFSLSTIYDILDKFCGKSTE